MDCENIQPGHLANSRISRRRENVGPGNGEMAASLDAHRALGLAGPGLDNGLSYQLPVREINRRTPFAGYAHDVFTNPGDSPHKNFTNSRMPGGSGSGARSSQSAPCDAAGLRFAGRWVSQSGICRTRGEGSNQDWMSANVLNPRDMSSGAR